MLKNINTIGCYTNFSKHNSQFTRCRCNVFYTGRNDNHSDITEVALQKMIQRGDYKNIPVVAHLQKDKHGNYFVGGHDERISVENNKVEIINECVPFGVIPEDCNPKLESYIEENGTEKTYFTVDIILWTHRYPIMKAAYSEKIYFNQSMEIRMNEADYDDDHYLVINDFTLQALCLLNKSDDPNKNRQPCFKESQVRSYSVNTDTFQKRFHELLFALKRESDKGKEFNKMKLSELQEVFDQMDTKETYHVLNASDNTVFALSLSDLKPYMFSYNNNETECVIDFNSKQEARLSATVRDTNDEHRDFMIQDYADEYAVHVTETATRELNKKIDELEAANQELEKQYTDTVSELQVYKDDEAERERQTHKKEVDSIVEKFAQKIGRVSEFLIYRSKLNYEKSIDDITRDLSTIAGKALVDSDKKVTFSYEPEAVSMTNGTNVSAQKDSVNERYGDLLDGFRN